MHQLPDSIVADDLRLGETDTSNREQQPELGNGAADAAARPVPAHPRPGPVPSAGLRPRVHGKFLYVGDDKLYIRGVTYGAFRPDAEGREYTDLIRIERDFAQMAASGFNAVRIPHTMPPRELLDIAEHQGLWVMVGLSCEQYVGYLIDRDEAPDIPALLREKVQSVASHPALLCYALGNEIPGSIARFIGDRRIERYLKRLYNVVKSEDPGAVVTYVNYPTTEYLRLGFLDLLACNVYLEDADRFAAYLARLHHLAGDRPLLMSEIGLDGLRNGVEEQARSLGSQIQTTFREGCAGAFVFSWTDEWHRGGEDVKDWEFGLTDRMRRPKPALHAVREACARIPFESRAWPRTSVVVCAYNAAATVDDTLKGCAELAYPNYEVIVVNDGSTDETETIAKTYDCRVITTPNRGLSAARNTGLWEATGEIVAYIDADAHPDPHWLHYLLAAFSSGDFKGIGGPNIAPDDGGLVASAVAHSPGGPAHVMLSDRVAEHIPGCNMAFFRDELIAVGGFDPTFRIAGDDVDICWRIQERGGTLGFSPAAMVWHHRRNSVRAFWGQQRHYGAAERLLEEKWPHKHNAAGHVAWSGRIYGHGIVRPLLRAQRIYHGLWGSAPFQSRLEREPHPVWRFAAMPEAWLAIALLLAIGALGALWAPLLWALPVAGGGATLLWLRAVRAASHALERAPVRLRALVVLLHLLQPMARLRGRLVRPTVGTSAKPDRRLPRKRRFAVWSDQWREPMQRLEGLRETLVERGVSVVVGGEYDRWDLEVRAGAFAAARLVMAVEDHGSGTQYVRFRSWPRLASGAGVLALVLFALATVAALTASGVVALILAATGILVSWRIGWQAAAATGAVLSALDQARTAE